MTETQTTELVALTALATIEHDGQRFEPGDRLDLPTAKAQPLIDCGAAQLVPSWQPDDAAPAEPDASVTGKARAAAKKAG